MFSKSFVTALAVFAISTQLAAADDRPTCLIEAMNECTNPCANPDTPSKITEFCSNNVDSAMNAFAVACRPIVNKAASGSYNSTVSGVAGAGATGSQATLGGPAVQTNAPAGAKTSGGYGAPIKPTASATSKPSSGTGASVSKGAAAAPTMGAGSYAAALMGAGLMLAL